MDVAGCAEHPVTLLPFRGAPPASCTPSEECPQMEQTPQCSPFGLTGSPRIGPHCEQCHSKEVKSYEGEEQYDDQHRGKRNPRALPSMQSYRDTATSNGRVKGIRRLDDRVTPEHLKYHEVKSMTTNNQKKGFINLELPPLPERAIKGLDHPWVSPKGELFHVVRLWEFPHLYVLLKHKMWVRISKFLRETGNLAMLARSLGISRTILANIRNNPDQSISVSNLRKISWEIDISLDLMETSIRAARFGQSGDPEFLSFPFTMNIHAWRALCHIIGDGNVNKRKDGVFPEFRWTQWTEKNEIRIKDIPPKKQRYMRNLLERLSRLPGGKGNNVNYPKALSYAIMGTIPTLTFDDLKTSIFIDFIIRLPKIYKDYKVQFLAAFTIDDGSVSSDISFHQKDRSILEKIMELCDQLGYDHSPYPPSKQQRDGMYEFSLRLRGVRDFYNDINEIKTKYCCDSLLGLWHFDQIHKHTVRNISDERLEDNQRAIEVYERIITIMNDSKIRKTFEIRQHPKLKPLVEGYSDKVFGDRLRNLTSMKIMQEVKKPNVNTSYRPKRWIIPPGNDVETLLEKFRELYGYRAHKQSYERQFVTKEMAITAMKKLLARGIKPNPTNTAHEGNFSRQIFYRRKDLSALFEDLENLKELKEHEEEE